jgi:hypothetical protein
MLNDFCAFILTHGRPNDVVTYDSLKKFGYTGKIYIIIDNEDKKANEYKRKFGKKIIMFDKLAISKQLDEGDNFNDRRAILYARNACFDIAKKLGIKYFIELDDDYTDFRYKTDNKFNTIDRKAINNLDKVFDILLNYYKSIPALSIAMAQGGDFFGGSKHNDTLICKRKCMNTFICSTDRPFKFFGRINEDVNVYTTLGGRGDLFLTITNVAIQQKATQKTKGGMSDIYLDNGTYIKSFYTIIYSPSCTKVEMMGSKHARLHHFISWDNAVPVIISEEYKKR